MTKEEFKVMFPSPCGDYGSYREDGLFDNVGGNFSFRPLAGIMVLIWVEEYADSIDEW